MDINYIKTTLTESTDEYRTSLLNILNVNSHFFNQELSRSALTFEYPSWQITLYSVDDLKLALIILRKMELPIPPAYQIGPLNNEDNKKLTKKNIKWNPWGRILNRSL